MLNSCLLLLVSVVCAMHVTAADVTADCPCSNSSWCQPVSKGPRKEVFIFTLTSDNSTWLKFDWDKVTTVVIVGFYDADLVCYAHSRDVRVVNLGSIPSSQLLNDTYRSDWVAEQVADAQNKFLDGFNIDFEDPLEDGSPEEAALTSFAQQMTDAFTQAIPGSQVTFDIAWSPNGIDGRFYDAVGLAKAVDFLFVMSYDEQSQIFDTDCTARANSPMQQTASGIVEFLNLGISADKLVLGVPWYGYNYNCLQLTSNNTCYIAEVPFRGCNCSDAAGSQYPYNVILANYLNISSSGYIWDATSQSPYFNYVDVDKGENHQVWYDDPNSLMIKYSLATSYKLRGVGMWTADFLDYSDTPEGEQQRNDMWGAIPDL